MFSSVRAGKSSARKIEVSTGSNGSPKNAVPPQSTWAPIPFSTRHETARRFSGCWSEWGGRSGDRSRSLDSHARNPGSRPDTMRRARFRAAVRAWRPGRHNPAEQKQTRLLFWPDRYGRAHGRGRRMPLAPLHTGHRDATPVRRTRRRKAFLFGTTHNGRRPGPSPGRRTPPKKRLWQPYPMSFLRPLLRKTSRPRSTGL